MLPGSPSPRGGKLRPAFALPLLRDPEMTHGKIIRTRRAPCAAAAVCAGLLAAFAVAAPRAMAAEASGPSLDFNLGANTDYVFRGVSQTDNDPSVFGGADASLGMAYAGVWVSNVDFGNGTDIEFDLYAGIKPTLGPVSLDIGVLYYGYTDQPAGSHEDYWEGKVTASIPAGPATLGAALYYSPEFFGKTGDASYYEVNAAVPIGETKFTVSGALGYQQVKGPLDYTSWNLGVGYSLNDHVGLDVRYFDTDEHRFGSIYDSRVVAGIKLIF